MTTKPLTATNFNVSNTTPQSFQIPQSYSALENEQSQNYSAPGSPSKLSPKNTLNPQGSRQALSPSSTYNPLMPQRANTENNDNQMISLFDIYNKNEFEETAVSQSAKKSCNAGNFKRFTDDVKTEKRSLSAEKSYKCGTPISRTIGLWAKENIPDISEKSTPGMKKKPRNSTEQVNRSVGGEAVIRFDNRKIKSTRRDVESDAETNGRYNTEEEGVEGLFDEDYYDKEAFMREGPIRYSKMSEEDAATIFETRRKELLSFLTKLGASSAISKKKFVNKNVGGSRLGTATSQNSDIGKNDFHREKGVRRLQDSLKENNSPTRFIIYNTTSDSNSLWNNNTSTQAGKFATPGKDKKMTNATRAGCESAPDEKRVREREELSPLVERNLEASFNQIVEWNDGMEKRSPVKVMKKAESTIKSYEERADPIENITIDLTKASKLKKKKKKAKKEKGEEEKWYKSEKVTIAKQVNEDVSFNQGWEQNNEVQIQAQVVEEKVIQKNLEVIKKKNLSVMNEIADLDSQIERMRESDNRALLSYRKIEDERELARKREESKRAFYADNSQEGYSNAAKLRKNAERSRSMSIKLAIRENLKINESMHENYSRGGLRYRENIGEDDVGNQSRRNQKVRFADDLTSSSKNSSQISQKEVKELKGKTLARVPSQTNTSVSSTVKVDLNKPNKTKAPVQKRALSNNTTASRSQDTNLTLSTISSPKNPKDFQLKNLDLGRANASLNHSFNMKTSQTTTNKSNEKIRISNDFTGSRIKESQQPMQQLKTKKMSRTSETNSTLQSVRESILTSPKELTFSLRKTPVSCSTPVPIIKKELSNCTPANSNKPIGKTKKPANKSISIKSNYRSVSDKDCSTEIPNLFENSTPVNEPASATPKVFFSKEVKRIIRDGSKDEKPSAPAVSKPKQAKSKEPVKSVKDVQPKVKKGEVNRPDFDLSSANNIRAKILRQSRPGQENLSFLKASVSPSNLSDSSKNDIKPFALEDFGISPAASQVKKLPFKKSETDKNLLRKGSLSTPRGFKVVTSPAATTTRGCLGLSLQDMREKLAEQACVEMDEDNESLDSFRLREKSLNLPLQSAQGKQGVNGKEQESKEAQTMKRKKAAGYSVC